MRLILAVLLLCASLPAITYAAPFNYYINFSLDTNPPAISSIQISSLTTSSATISWTTDVSSDSSVEYGTTSSYGSSSSYNPSMTLFHSASITGLSPATAYHFRIVSADSNGLLGYSGDQTFTTSSLPVQNSSGSGGGGGGGGSGGAGSSAPPAPASNSSVPIDSVTLVATPSANYPAVLELPSSFPVRTITLRTTEPITVTLQIKNTQTLSVPAPGGIVYKYIKIDSDTERFQSVEMEFPVPISWMNDNSMVPEDIRLVRYTDRWQRMNITDVRQNSTDYIFKAVTPGFSVYAITGDKSAEEAQTAPPADSGNPLVSLDSAVSINIQYFIIAGVLVLIAVLAYLYGRHKKGKK